MMYCKKCMVVCGAIFLVLGVLFLLRDLGKWDFWNIQWWTALFIAMGVGHLASSKCPECEVARSGRK